MRSKTPSDPASSTQETSSGIKRRRLYGRRRGRILRQGRKALLEDVLPELRVAVEETDDGVAPIDPAALFDFPVTDVWLEIGFGAGEHLAARAGAHPDIGFIGAEHFLAGIAGLLKHISDGALRNIRIFQDDAAVLLDALPDASLGRVFLLYPDPWPKARHEKRRFLSHENLDRLRRVMKPGAEFFVATDHPVYRAWAVERMASRDDFEWLAESPKDWREAPADWPGTRYEAKAIRERRIPTYLRYRRV
jgi:tRNA (guanine-N7-)-methyltransferase